MRFFFSIFLRIFRRGFSSTLRSNVCSNSKGFQGNFVQLRILPLLGILAFVRFFIYIFLHIFHRCFSGTLRSNVFSNGRTYQRFLVHLLILPIFGLFFSVFVFVQLFFSVFLHIFHRGFSGTLRSNDFSVGRSYQRDFVHLMWLILIALCILHSDIFPSDRVYEGNFAHLTWLILLLKILQRFWILDIFVIVFLLILAGLWSGAISDQTLKP